MRYHLLMKSLLVGAMLATLVGTGCYKATVQLRNAPGARSALLDEKFSLHLINVIPLNGTHDIVAACPNGEPVAIHDGLSFVGGLANAVLGTAIPVLGVWNSSVDCGGGAVQAPPPENAAVQ